MNVVCSLIMQKGKVLIAQRPLDKPSPGLWEFPGGKQEIGESLKVSLKRELNEELKIQTQPESLIFVGSVLTEQLTLHLFTQKLESYYLPVEHRAVQWAAFDQLLSYPMCPSDSLALKDFEAPIRNLF